MQPPSAYYLHFSRAAWSAFRRDTPLTLSAEEIQRLRGQNEPVSVDEVEAIYLPLSRLLNLYVAASQDLYAVSTRFLGRPEPKVPYVIGVAGSVAVGKSTTSRVLQALLSRWPNHPRVALVTTDGYLLPNAVLEARRISLRKGFPESYDTRALLRFLADLKAGVPRLRVPMYSHHVYDIIPDQYHVVDQPDIVIVEGVNVLQVGRSASDAPRVFVSDFFDFSIYVDANASIIEDWYLQRFLLFRERARTEPEAFFYRFAQMSDADAIAFAGDVWRRTNAVNLAKNILPYKERARCILEKGADHTVQNVFLRRA